MRKAARHQLSRVALTSRDIDILLMIYSYGGVTIDVIQRRFWKTFRSCYTRIDELSQSKYIIKHRISTFSEQGTPRLFLTPGKNAVAIIAAHLKLPVSQLARKSRIRVPAIVFHHRLASHFRVSVDLAARTLIGVSIQDWENEASLAKHPIIALSTETTGGKEKEQEIRNIPDRAFTIYLPGDEIYSFLVEIDTGTVSMGTMKQKIRGYLLHADAEPEAARPILIVVLDHNRQVAMVSWVLQVADALSLSPSLFAVATFSQLTEQAVLIEPVWTVPGLEKPQTLLPRERIQTLLPRTRGVLIEGSSLRV